MGTNIQSVIDAFCIKLPSVDFSSQEDVLFQIFKSAIGYTSSTLGTLTYTVDETIYEGTFIDTLTQSDIELISLGMVREYYRRPLSAFMFKKQHIGTKDFDKLPNLKDGYAIAKDVYATADAEFEKYKHEFYSYVE